MFFIEIPVFNVNSADPDPTPRSAVSVLGLIRLPMPLFAPCVVFLVRQLQL